MIRAHKSDWCVLVTDSLTVYVTGRSYPVLLCPKFYTNSYPVKESCVEDE